MVVGDQDGAYCHCFHQVVGIGDLPAKWAQCKLTICYPLEILLLCHRMFLHGILHIFGYLNSRALAQILESGLWRNASIAAMICSRFSSEKFS